MVGDRVSDWTLHKLGRWASNQQRHVQLYDDGVGGRWAKVGGCWMQPSGCHLHMWKSVSKTLSFIFLFYWQKSMLLLLIVFCQRYICSSNMLLMDLWYIYRLMTLLLFICKKENDVALFQLIQIFVFVIKQGVLKTLLFFKSSSFAIVVHISENVLVSMR